MAPAVSRFVQFSALALASLNRAQAFWRLPCQARSGLGRLDPIISPGQVSGHVHAIHGGSNFGMSATGDELKNSNCTSCAVIQDHSAYWTPALYFQDASTGEYTLVDQVGGTLVYYFLFGNNIQPFPDNFQMIAGDTNRRNFTLPVPDPPQSNWGPSDTTQAALAQKAIGFNCLDYSKPDEPSLGRHFLPPKSYLDANCTDGVRFELMFPSCWNGKDADSPDHKSHMAYPNLVKTGTCPSGYQTQVVSLFYETIWNTYAFNGKAGEFVIASGDPTGYGYHGDFIAGWNPSVLQQAINTCTNPSGQITDCPVFTGIQDSGTQAQCHFEMPSQLSEDCTGPRSGLPGNVPIQAGPQPATNAANTGGSAAPPPASSSGAVSAAAAQTGSGAAPANVNEDFAVGASPPSPTSPPASTPSSTASFTSTSTYTSNNEVVEVLIEATQVYVTANARASGAANRKRHLLQHKYHHHHPGRI